MKVANQVVSPARRLDRNGLAGIPFPKEQVLHEPQYPIIICASQLGVEQRAPPIRKLHQYIRLPQRQRRSGPIQQSSQQCRSAEGHVENVATAFLRWRNLVRSIKRQLEILPGPDIGPSIQEACAADRVLGGPPKNDKPTIEIEIVRQPPRIADDGWRAHSETHCGCGSARSQPVME